MWKQKDKLNSTKIDILEKHFQVDLSDAKHGMIKREYCKPIKGSSFKTLKFFYNDSCLYSLDNMKHFYCFNESEVKSKENSLLLPWDNLLKDCYFIDENLIPIPLTERYTHKVVKLHRIEYKGRFYYIGCS